MTKAINVGNYYYFYPISACEWVCYCNTAKIAHYSAVFVSTILTKCSKFVNKAVGSNLQWKWLKKILSLHPNL